MTSSGSSGPMAVAAFVATCPPTVTRPATTSSAAWPRERARPRRTNSASNRARLTTVPEARCSSGAVEIGKRILQLAMQALVDPDVLARWELVEPREFGDCRVHARHARGVGQRPRSRCLDRAIDIAVGLAVGLAVDLGVGRGVRLEIAAAVNVLRREVGDAFLVDVIVEPVVSHATTLPVAALPLR